MSVVNYGANPTTSVTARSRRGGNLGLYQARLRSIKIMNEAGRRTGRRSGGLGLYAYRAEALRLRPGLAMTVTSPRVEAFMDAYRTLSDAQQSMMRDMVELAYRRHLTERLEVSVPVRDLGWGVVMPFSSPGAWLDARALAGHTPGVGDLPLSVSAPGRPPVARAARELAVSEAIRSGAGHLGSGVAARLHVPAAPRPGELGPYKLFPPRSQLLTVMVIGGLVPLTPPP